MRINRDTNRFITRFLILPKTIDGETRWLEKARFEKTYDKDRNIWKDVCWSD